MHGKLVVIHNIPTWNCGFIVDVQISRCIPRKPVLFAGDVEVNFNWRFYPLIRAFGKVVIHFFTGEQAQLSCRRPGDVLGEHHPQSFLAVRQLPIKVRTRGSACGARCTLKLMVCDWLEPCGPNTGSIPRTSGWQRTLGAVTARFSRALLKSHFCQNRLVCYTFSNPGRLLKGGLWWNSIVG